VVPVDHYDIQQPVFFGGCKHDTVSMPALGRATLAKHCKNIRYKEFDHDHWVCLSHPEEVNKELLAWIDANV